QAEVHAVTVLPGAVQGQVARGAGEDRQSGTIQLHRAPTRRPVGNPDAQRQLDGSLRVDHKGRSLLLREIRFLTKLDTFFRPAQFRSDEEIDEDSALVVEVDRVGELRELLGARSRAAPEGAPRRVVV